MQWYKVLITLPTLIYVWVVAPFNTVPNLETLFLNTAFNILKTKLRDSTSVVLGQSFRFYNTYTHTQASSRFLFIFLNHKSASEVQVKANDLEEHKIIKT